MKSGFLKVLADWPLERVERLLADQNNPESVRRALNEEGLFSPENLAALLSPAAENSLRSAAAVAGRLTRRHFGRAVSFFVPLYVSNICCNGCVYCGFNCKSTSTIRRALTLDEAQAEAEFLAKQGFSHLLLVASEDLKNTPPLYFAQLTERIRHLFASIHIEIYALSEPDYRLLVEAGVDGVTMFQETYKRPEYAHYHPFGPKSDFENRFDAVERAARAGISFLGLGALLGLTQWQSEVFYLGLHTDYLRRTCWRQNISISFPRMRPADGGETAPFAVGDKSFVQILTALRIQFPDTCMTISTREAVGFREHLVDIAATKLSAGAKTTPGGYSDDTAAGAQFDIADHRSLVELSQVLTDMGYDPVLKDWDRSYGAA